MENSDEMSIHALSSIVPFVKRHYLHMKIVPLHEYEDGASSRIAQQRVGERHVPFRIQVAVENDHLCAVLIRDAPW